MILEKQFAPVELCRKLFTVYHIYESMFTWAYDRTHGQFALSRLRYEAHELLNNSRGVADRVEVYPAFSVAELGVMLSDCELIQWVASFAHFDLNEFGAAIISEDEELNLLHEVGGDEPLKSEAEARAALLLHLLNIGYYNAEDVKTRLAL